MKYVKQFWFYLFPPKDWTIVWSENGVWKYNGEHLYNAIYNIEYSRYRHTYRLVTSGYEPKNHSMYPIALKTLAKYNSLTYVK